MDLEALLRHYFGTDDPDTLDEVQLAQARERLGIAFGVEREPGRRFALWSLMEAFDWAPPPADAFDEEPDLRRAAEEYLSAAWRIERD